jgi:Tol biopolymer transport system component/DNA-binding winged helix-turn-helix (wHTH) protein
MAAGAAQPRQDIIRFGEFELDLSRQTLSLRGVRTKLQKQPFQVLELLIQRAPEIVSRDEIRRHVWGDSVHIDAPQSINFCIRQIRLALGDTSAGRFVETLPRQGYRFVAPLEGMPENTGISEQPPIPEFRPRVAAPPWLIPGLAALVVLAAIAGLWGWLQKRDIVSGVARISPVTTYPGDEREPSLSPDGRQVAFSWEGKKGNNRDIYVTLLGGQHPLRITYDPAEDASPAWSPDGKHIAFIRRHAGTQAAIMLVPTIGGPERKLREIRLGAWIASRTLAWSPDGKWLCFTNEVGKSGHHNLFLLSPESGVVKPLLSEQRNGVGDSSPAFSPDGRWVAFGRFTYPYNSQLLLQRLSPDLTPEGTPVPVKNAGINPKAPVWMPDGKKVLFLEGSRIMEAEIGSPARSFYVSGSAFNELSMAGPSPLLVASLQNQNEQIWTISLGTNGLTTDGNAQRIVQSSAGEAHPRFSPDGRSLAFCSKRSGSLEVWLADSDGENQRQLTHLSGYIAGYPHWSPDGQSLAFHARLPREPQIYVVRVQDGALRQITRSEPGFTAPSWSMDGRILYADALEDGKTQIYSVAAAGGAPRLLWEGAAAVEAPGRKLLLYFKEDQSGIYGRSLAGDAAKNPERLLVTDYQAPWGGFYPVDDGIYYVGSTSNGRPRAFCFYSFQTGKSVDIAPSPTYLSLGLTVTPDRTRLAYATKSQGIEDIVQIELK